MEQSQKDCVIWMHMSSLKGAQQFCGRTGSRDRASPCFPGSGAPLEIATCCSRSVALAQEGCWLGLKQALIVGVPRLTIHGLHTLVLQLPAQPATLLSHTVGCKLALQVLPHTCCVLPQTGRQAWSPCTHRLMSCYLQAVVSRQYDIHSTGILSLSALIDLL